MLSHIRPAIGITVLFTLLLGVAYPLAITGVAHLAFPAQAGGSLIRDSSGHVIGSALIGQNFAKAEYLHPRPSAAGMNGYDPTSSGGTNLGPLNPTLIKSVKSATDALRPEANGAPIPADAVTSSASGLDPDISPAFALLQAARIAKARGADEGSVREFIATRIQGPALGFLGQPRVNVLTTNLALDARYPLKHAALPAKPTS